MSKRSRPTTTVQPALKKKPKRADTTLSGGGSDKTETSGGAEARHGTSAAPALLAPLTAAYASLDAYAVARAERSRQRADGVYRDSIQYGEIDPASFARCLEWVAPIADGEAFFDLGSGSGKAVLTAALLHPFGSATGIEIQPALHAAALDARRRLDAAAAALRAASVDLRCGDAFAADAAWPDEAGVVFCTTTCFTPELRAALLRGVERMRDGARLIVTTQALESPRLTLLRRDSLPYAKGSLHFFAYRVGSAE